MPVVLAVQIRPAQREMDFDDKSVLRRSRTVMPERDVRPDQIQPEVFKALDFLSHIRMDGRSELNISRTDVNLHTSSYIRVKPMSNPERALFPPILGGHQQLFYLVAKRVVETITGIRIHDQALFVHQPHRRDRSDSPPGRQQIVFS